MMSNDLSDVIIYQIATLYVIGLVGQSSSKLARGLAQERHSVYFSNRCLSSAGLQRTWMGILHYWHTANTCPIPLWKVAQWGRNMYAPHPPRQQLYSPCASITVKASEHWSTSEPQSPPSSSKGTWKSSIKGSAPSLPRASDFRRPRPGYSQDPTV